MIITIEEQQRLIGLYDVSDKKAVELIAFMEGMNAMMELVDKKLTAEREALQPEQPQTKD